MKRTILFLVMLVVAFSLVACGGGTEGTKSDSGASSSGESSGNSVKDPDWYTNRVQNAEDPVDGVVIFFYGKARGKNEMDTKELAKQEARSEVSGYLISKISAEAGNAVGAINDNRNAVLSYVRAFKTEASISGLRIVNDSSTYDGEEWVVWVQASLPASVVKSYRDQIKQEMTNKATDKLEADVDKLMKAID